MRIIAGSARGRRLVAPPGRAVRPTSERLREALFSVIGDRIEGACLWDVCAGTGAVGIEALSRGAGHVVFSEPAAAARKALARNLVASGLSDAAEVLALEWRRAGRMLSRRRRRFDFVFYDPPYAGAEAADLLVLAAPLMAADAWFLIEHETRRAPAAPPGFEVQRKLKAGGSTISLMVVAGAAGTQC